MFFYFIAPHQFHTLPCFEVDPNLFLPQMITIKMVSNKQCLEEWWNKIVKGQMSKQQEQRPVSPLCVQSNRVKWYTKCTFKQVSSNTRGKCINYIATTFPLTKNNRYFGAQSKWAASWQNQQNGMCAQWRLRSAWAHATLLVFVRRQLSLIL